MTNCYYCGDDDHAGKECPKLREAQRTATATIPARATGRRGQPATWCSYCDEITRLIDAGDSVARCPQCHPLRYAQLKQHRKCPKCHATVYVWDYNDCGGHQGPALPRRAATRPESTRP